MFAKQKHQSRDRAVPTWSGGRMNKPRTSVCSSCMAAATGLPTILRQRQLAKPGMTDAALTLAISPTCRGTTCKPGHDAAYESPGYRYPGMACPSAYPASQPRMKSTALNKGFTLDVCNKDIENVTAYVEDVAAQESSPMREETSAGENVTDNTASFLLSQSTDEDRVGGRVGPLDSPSFATSLASPSGQMVALSSLLASCIMAVML
eukprot:365942-Chlamydomonas_euryale.AAC.29